METVKVTAETANKILTILLYLNKVMATKDQVEAMLKDIKTGNMRQLVMDMPSGVWVNRFESGKGASFTIEQTGKEFVVEVSGIFMVRSEVVITGPDGLTDLSKAVCRFNGTEQVEPDALEPDEEMTAIAGCSSEF